MIDGITQAQNDTLDQLIDPAYALRIAKAGYVNQALAVDGTLVSAIGRYDAAFDAVIAGLLAEAKTPEVFAKCEHLSRLKAEAEEHIAQGRFLFIESALGIPYIYFQCAVAGNPDTPPLAGA